MTPADELRALRLRLGMTQAQLAEAVGVEGNERVRTEMVGRWERGTHKVRGAVLMLARAMVEEKEQSEADREYARKVWEEIKR